MDRHGSQQRHEEAAQRFRFSRIVPGDDEQPLEERTVQLLALAMTAGGGSSDETSHVPSGYTYLGQFIAHDLTFDKTCVMLGEDVTPAALVQGASPRLDLDSLYGAGPGDHGSEGFYEGERLRTGTTVATPRHGVEDGYDLPREPGGKALIPDERNDDNLAVAQTHLAFIRFHNRVVDFLAPQVAPGDLFHAARELVTKHYQWMIRSDYLPRICAATVLDDVFRNGRKVFEVGADTPPTMPVEFSIGTFRLGHSMVRDVYRWNRSRDTVTLADLFRYSAKSGDLGGNDGLPSDVIADFRRLYDFRADGIEALAAEAGELNFAMRIDTRLLGTLCELPLGAFGASEPPPGRYDRNLAFRNLNRARMVGLASGPQMAEVLSGTSGVDVVPLSRDDIVEGRNGARLDNTFSEERKRELAARAPLWFYVLREAEASEGRLNWVGARIVAETFHRAIEGSDASIVRDAGWRPTLGRDGERFGMADLLAFAFESDPRQLAPLG